MNNKLYLIALNRIRTLGPVTIAKLLEHWPDLAVLFQSSKDTLLKAGLSARLAELILTFDKSLVEQDLRWEAASKHHTILTWDDEAYPAILKEIYDAPPVLYAIGRVSMFRQPAVAMVGSRKPSITGHENAYRFAYELSRNHVSIISGLALGVDAKAHEGCLDAEGNTIAVLGCGIDNIYPARHQKLAGLIKEKGLLLSEFPLGTPPAPGHFPRRNRIISGLSLATLVVEAAMRSGSLITARMALEQNRDVFAIPGSIHNPLARGCHHLLQQGAKLVTSCEDILNELDFARGIPFNQQDIKECPVSHSQDETLIKFMGFEVTTVDTLIERSGLSIDKVVCDLADLELSGMIKAVPGGYMRCVL